MTARHRLVVAAVAAGVATAPASSALGGHFAVHPLVSDQTDRQLVNPWGLAARSGGAWWVANEARSSSTVYGGDGHKQVGSIGVQGGPTGVVFYGGRGFPVHGARRSAPARFVYACEDGAIRAWTPTVPTAWSTRAEVVVDTGASGTVLRGLTLSSGHLYATDFHNARILVFDSQWRRVRRRGAFVDPSIPEWYAPFGIAALGGHIFVTYASRAPVNGNDAPVGGYVDEFDPRGRLIAHVGASTQFDEPWGLALAPRGFGRLDRDLLVANFGSGRINIYGPRGRTWNYRGRMPITVPGVWGISFGTGDMSGARTSLFYVAGPHRWHGASEVDVHGVFGVIVPSG